MKNVTFTKRLKQIVDKKRIAVVGMGNVDRSDDGFGIKVAESLKLEFPDRIFIEDEGMEGILNTINEREDIDFVVFVDTVDANEKNGTLLIIEKENIEDVKTSHKIPLKLYLSLIDKPSCIIGIQPEQLNFMQPVSEEVEDGIRKTLKMLKSIMKDNLGSKGKD